MHNRPKATFFVLICVALWALIPVVAKLGQSNLDNHQFLFWSSLVSFCILSFAAVLKKEAAEIFTYSFVDWSYLIFLGLLGTYIYYLFLYLGYSKTSGMEVLVIQYTWPILIVILSLFMLKERLTIKKSIAIGLGFLGVLLVLSKGDLSAIKIDNASVILWVGVGAFSFALFSVLSKRLTKAPLAIISIYFLSASIASFISMFYFSEFALPLQSDWKPILLNGILVNGFSYLFWLIALRSDEASYLAPFVFISPVLSAIYLILFFDEPILPVYIFGLACVVLGGLVNSIRFSKG